MATAMKAPAMYMGMPVMAAATPLEVEEAAAEEAEEAEAADRVDEVEALEAEEAEAEAEAEADALAEDAPDWVSVVDEVSVERTELPVDDAPEDEAEDGRVWEEDTSDDEVEEGNVTEDELCDVPELVGLAVAVPETGTLVARTPEAVEEPSPLQLKPTLQQIDS